MTTHAVQPLPPPTTRRVPVKVAQATSMFWVIKLLTTGMGESASDFLSEKNLLLAGLVGGAGVGGHPRAAVPRGPLPAAGLLVRRRHDRGVRDDGCRRTRPGPGAAPTGDHGGLRGRGGRLPRQLVCRRGHVVGARGDHPSPGGVLLGHRALHLRAPPWVTSPPSTWAWACFPPPCCSRWPSSSPGCCGGSPGSTAWPPSGAPTCSPARSARRWPTGPVRGTGSAS